MDEIPEDVMREARKIKGMIEIFGIDEAEGIISQAILAERKRSENRIRELEYQIKMQGEAHNAILQLNDLGTKEFAIAHKMQGGEGMIPNDVRNMVDQLVGRSDLSNVSVGELIAAAIVEERERCAKIAESMYTDYYGDPSSDIAAAIRGTPSS